MSAVRFLAEGGTADVPDISARQFGQGLWNERLISFDECAAFVQTGTIPPALQTLINALPDDNTGAPTARKVAVILISGATVYQRSNPLVDQLGAEKGWDRPTMDAKWRAWAAL